MSELRADGVPVLVGVVPLFCVTSFNLTEGYQSVRIGVSSRVQLVRPTTKKITIRALLPGPWRLLRPLLEGMALSSRALAATSAPLMKFTGIPVVATTAASLDMQITSLDFTQDAEKRDTLSVTIVLEHVPRARLSDLLGAGLDLAVAAAGPFI
jgi:hypothetical protein